jgi:hypothetical protein
MKVLRSAPEIDSSIMVCAFPFVHNALSERANPGADDSPVRSSNRSLHLDQESVKKTGRRCGKPHAPDSEAQQRTIRALLCILAAAMDSSLLSSNEEED